MKTIKIAIFILLIFIAAQFVQAQETSPAPDSSPQSTEAAAPGELSFPIPELGNCGDFTSCANYCEDPVHNTACIDYAKKKRIL